jgi:agmatine deiminase
MVRLTVPTGVRLPAETVPHERMLMAWPTATRKDALWHDALDEARAVYALVARVIAAQEPVLMVANPDEVNDAVTRCGPSVEMVPLEIDDSWMRDIGPLVVRARDGRRHAVLFHFNAWGEKYEPYAADARVAERMAAILEFPAHQTPLVLEGGAIAVDGAGTLVTTERCVLNPNRNPRMSRKDAEGVFRAAFGVKRVVWLPDAIAEDTDTDGHVDNVVAFPAPATALLQGCDDDANPNHAIAARNRAILEAEGVEVTELPVLPYADVLGASVPVPYLNYVVANGVVVVPVTGHPADGDALATIGTAYPGREVVGVPGALLAYGGGGVHCITQPVPA